MRRPNKPAGKAAKTQRRRTLGSRSTAKIAHHRKSSSVDAAERIALLEHRLNEALEQQTATSEVLQTISSSTGDLNPVFKSILENATRICEAKFGVLVLTEGEKFRMAAMHGVPPAFVEKRTREPIFTPGPNNNLALAMQSRKTQHVADLRQHRSYAEGEPAAVALADVAGARTLVVVPMLNDNRPIGAVAIYRTEVRPFSDKQVELVTNFAAQAVIAIENARLLNELRESLQRQTATADVLKVISSSPGELEPVFKAMLESALRICEAEFGMLMLHSGGGSFDTRVMVGAPPALVDVLLHRSFTPPPGNPLDRMLRTKKTVHLVDAAAEKAKPPSAYLAGARSHINVPLVKQNEVVGAISIYRTEVRPFTDKQIELVTNFAAQAVIAIENTRLLSELRESLQQQTATADVLKVISSSPGDLEPVFGALLENATRICEAQFGNLSLYNGETFQNVALHNPPAEYADRGLGEVIRPHAESGLAHVARTKQIAHIGDIRTQPPYLEGDSAAVSLADVAGARTLLIVPMIKENALVGTIAIYRQEVRLFTDKQIELVQNFAAQAVIAIENTRLLSELRESLQQQTATADVLKIIASSPGELQPVFDAMLANATRLCEASYGVMWLREGDGFRSAALHGSLPAAYVERWQSGTLVHPSPDAPMMRVAETHQPVQVPDMRESRGYLAGDPLPVSAVEVAGIRTVLSVPMFKEEMLLGVITIYRQEVRPFTDKQIELLKNFASQAVIAIENVRLLSELRESLQQQTATADVLKLISRSTFDLQTVLQTLVEVSGAALRCR